MRKQPTSEAIEMMLDDPLLRMHLAHSWPHPRCACGASAQAVFVVRFSCESDEMPDWYEYRLGCHPCFTSGFGTNVKPQRELPTQRMFITVVRNGRKETFPIVVPVRHRKVSIGMVLALTCISQASPTVQILLT